MSSPLVTPLQSHLENSEESSSELSDLPRKQSSSTLEHQSRHDMEHPTSSRTHTSAKTPPSTKRSLSKRNLHARSQSHTKAPVRLSTSANPSKPLLNRSRSTDGISRAGRAGIKRNNRSYTKVSGLHPLTKTLLNGSSNRVLGVLQPLTKTMSNTSLKQYGLKKTMLNTLTKGAPYLKETLLDQSIRSSKSSGSLRGMNGGSSTSIMHTATGGIKTSAKRGRAILKLNEDAEDNDYEDLSEDSEAENDILGPDNDKLESISDVELQRQFRPSEEPQEMGKDSAVSKVKNEVLDLDGAPVSKLGKIKQLEDPNLKNVTSKTSFISSNSSSEDLVSKNLYGGSMLLSQSTGLTRKLNTVEPMSYALEDSELLKNQPESLSGIVFNAPNDERQNAIQSQARPVSSGGSYQPNQSIFSNLQRTNTKFLSDMKQQSENTERASHVQSDSNSKDFSHFLNNSASGGHLQHDTRTQQRLWLQRENSLMDVGGHIDTSKFSNFSNLSLNKLMFAHNYSGSTANMQHILGGESVQSNNGNGSESASPHDASTPTAGDNALSVTNLLYLIQGGHQNSIQSRIEFERLNREYVNVRRHLNPVAESLNRVETYMKLTTEIDVPKQRNKKAAIGLNRNANTFKEYAPNFEEKQEEMSGTIGRLWLEALLTSSASNISLQLLKQEHQNQQNQQANLAQQIYHQQLQQQQQEQQQLRAYGHNIPSIPNRTMAPTTRAVKAAQAAAASTLQR